MQPTHAEQQSAANAAIATSYDRLASRNNSLEEEDDDEDEVIEQDPEGNINYSSNLSVQLMT
jgi:hypothetical protein